MKFTKFETLSIKDHPELGETWMQTRNVERPKILFLREV